MMDKKFKSVLAPYFEAFLKESLLMRRATDQLKRSLRLFDKYLFKHNVTNPAITQEVFDGWAKTYLEDSVCRTVYQKCMYVVRFLEYMNEVGIACYVPRREAFKVKPFIPYIFTHEEIKKLFSAADSWRDECLKPDSAIMAMPLLLRILYSTAMRINEVLSLKNKDVILDKRIIRITETKNDCQRIAVINDSLYKCISQYLEYRNKLPGNEPDVNAPESYFLVNHTRRKIDDETVRFRFHKLLRTTGIVGNNPKNHSRVHDLRHTACVHVMMKLIDEDYDLYNSIPVISAFMGHKNLYCTERYMRFTLAMFPDMIKRGKEVSFPIDEMIKDAALGKFEFEQEYD